MTYEFTGPINGETAVALRKLGYTTKYGGDGHLHILPIAGGKWGKAGRGQRGLCGATASRLDLHHEKPICDACAKRMAFQKEGQWYLIPAYMQEEVS